MKKESGEDATRGDEDEADRVNAQAQPDWEEVAAVSGEALARRGAGTLTSDAIASLRARLSDAVPHDRPELLADFEALLASEHG